MVGMWLKVGAEVKTEDRKEESANKNQRDSLCSCQLENNLGAEDLANFHKFVSVHDVEENHIEKVYLSQKFKDFQPYKIGNLEFQVESGLTIRFEQREVETNENLFSLTASNPDLKKIDFNSETCYSLESVNINNDYFIARFNDKKEDSFKTFVIVDLELFEVLYRVKDEKELWGYSNFLHYENGTLFCESRIINLDEMTEVKIPYQNDMTFMCYYDGFYYYRSDSYEDVPEPEISKLNLKTGEKTKIALNFGREMPKKYVLGASKLGNILVILVDLVHSDA